MAKNTSQRNKKLSTRVSTKKKKPARPKEPAPVLGEDDKTTFVSGLKQGLGVTQAANLILWHPEKITKLIRSDKELYTECMDAVKFSAKSLLVSANKNLNDRKLDKWQRDRAALRDFTTDIVLWGDIGILKNLKDDDIVRGYEAYKNFTDLATAVSVLKTELMNHIYSNKILSIYFTEKDVL